MTAGQPNAGYSHGPDDQGRALINGAEGGAATEDGGASVLDMTYPELRKRALQQRNLSTASETLFIRELYVFWKSFLRSSFNARMYEDFRSFALEDARQQIPNTYGLERLLGFYGSVFNGKPPVWMQDKPFPNILLHHQAEAEHLGQSIKPANHP